MNYEGSLPKEFGEELSRAPVAYLPWCALEWHGRHLPLGLDSLKAHSLCEMVADRAGGIVVPPCGAGSAPWPKTASRTRWSSAGTQ